MGLRDFQWDITKVGTIVKHVSENFTEHDSLSENNRDFKKMMHSLGYGAYQERDLQEALEFIKGNPLLFMYFLICIEYKSTPTSLESTSQSVIQYIFRKFDKKSRYQHENYIQGLTQKFYNNFEGDCQRIFSMVIYGF